MKYGALLPILFSVSVLGSSVPNVEAHGLFKDNEPSETEVYQDSVESGDGMKAFEALQKGNVDEARTYLAKANPSNPYAMYVRARLTTDAVEAADMYKQIVAENSGKPIATEALKQLYEFHYAAGQYAAARTDSLELRSITSGTDSVDSSLPHETTESVSADSSQREETSSLPRRADLRPTLYVVQLGAFSSMENARQFVSDMQVKGIDAKIFTKPLADRTLYGVSAGVFHTQEAAEKFAGELKGKSINCIVVVR